MNAVTYIVILIHSALHMFPLFPQPHPPPCSASASASASAFAAAAAAVPSHSYYNINAKAKKQILDSVQRAFSREVDPPGKKPTIVPPKKDPGGTVSLYIMHTVFILSFLPLHLCREAGFCYSFCCS